MILIALGNCYLDTQDYENAAASYRSLIESMPDSQRVPSAYLLLASSLQNLGRFQEAEVLYRKVIESYGESVEAHQAKEYLDFLSSTDPERVEARTTETRTAEHDSATQTASYFSIQVGAFSVKRNAINLAHRLRRKGYSVNIVSPVPGKSRLYKVRIGTFKSETAAQRAAWKLGRNEKLDTEIVSQ